MFEKKEKRKKDHPTPYPPCSLCYSLPRPDSDVLGRFRAAHPLRRRGSARRAWRSGRRGSASGRAVRAASRRATAARRARGRCGQGSPGVGRPGPGGAAAAARRARRAGRARRRERNRGGRRPAPGKAAPGWRPVDLEVGQRGCQATEVSSMGVPRRRRLLLLGRPPFLLLLGLRPRAWMLAGRLGASPLPRDAAPPLPWRRRTTAR